MTPDDYVRLINTGLNLLAIPALWVLVGIKSQLATLAANLSNLKDRVDRLEDGR